MLKSRRYREEVAVDRKEVEYLDLFDSVVVAFVDSTEGIDLVEVACCVDVHTVEVR
jgi:hypothetical protein